MGMGGPPAAALRGRGFGDNAGLLWSHMFRVHVVIRGIKVKGIQGESYLMRYVCILHIQIFQIQFFQFFIFNFFN